MTKDSDSLGGSILTRWLRDCKKTLQEASMKYILGLGRWAGSNSRCRMVFHGSSLGHKMTRELSTHGCRLVRAPIS